MQITVQIKELIQNVTSTDVHCIKRHSRCFAYGVGVVGGVTNYALLISKVFPVPTRVIRGGGWKREREPNRDRFLLRMFHLSFKKPSSGVVTDSWHSGYFPRSRPPTPTSPTGCIAMARGRRHYNRSGVAVQKPFEHMALCHPVNLRFTHATDGRRTKVITATRAADMREEGAQRRDARRVSHFFLVGGHPGGSPAKVRIASCTP